MMKNCFFQLILLIAVSGVAAAQDPAKFCDTVLCQLPDCWCGGSNIPGGSKPEDIPQFVTLTFDDYVYNKNKVFFDELFEGRTNPNGCPIKATFYVTNHKTNYTQVQGLYATGHEMASHTLSHERGTNFTIAQWAEELVSEAEMLVRLAGVDRGDIRGMRAPYLAVGADNMFRALNRNSFLYDSSMVTSVPSWPYTLDYQMPHPCCNKPCPELSHPGMWEVPIALTKDVHGNTCYMADSCYYDKDATSVQNIFMENFLKHYNKSKTPFPLFFHSRFFTDSIQHKIGFFEFIDSILDLPDVYFVTSQQLINWTRYPEPLNDIVNGNMFKCNLKK